MEINDVVPCKMLVTKHKDISAKLNRLKKTQDINYFSYNIVPVFLYINKEINHAHNITEESYVKYKASDIKEIHETDFLKLEE